MKSLRGRRSASLTMEERITYYLSRVAIDPQTGCWKWLGKIRKDGYAIVCINFRDRLLHQVVYEYFEGERPTGTNIHHTCGTKHCVYPRHLTLLSVADHARLHPEGMKAAYQASAKLRRSETHCQRGHEFNEENTYWTKDGWRMCRSCARIKKRMRNGS